MIDIAENGTIAMNPVSPREFTVEDLPEINPQFFNSGESYNTVVMGTTRQGMTFNTLTDCVPQTTGEGMSVAANQIQDHLLGAGGRVIVFDKGHSTFGPMRPLPE